jgi:uncharacterized protein YpmS
VASLVRLAFLAAVILVVFVVVRECVPVRVVYPSNQTAAQSTPSPTATATAAPTATPQSTFTLTVTDAELTQAASSSFPQTVSGVTVRDPVVRTTPSDVRLTATARVFFGTTEFVMIGHPYASAGRVAVRVDSVTLGGFGLPDSVRASTQSTVESAIARLVPPTVTVQRVSMGNGTVTIEGVTQR